MASERLAKTTGVLPLKNGKFRGVVIRRAIGRVETDELQIRCEHERDSPEEALRDAEELANRGGQ